MKLLWRVVLVLGIVVLASGPARAVEPFLEFVKGLREREYFDTAILYLDQLEKRSDVPADVKEVIPFEKAITLLKGADNLRNAEAKTRQLDQARAQFEQFLKASPTHANAGEANTELANVIVSKGKVEVLQSRSPANAGQKAEFQKRARAQFAEARKVFQAAYDRYKEAYDKFDKFIPKTEKARYEARELAYRNFIQAQLNLSILTYEEAQTYDKGSTENRKMLTDAANAFEQIHARYRQMLSGLYARMWQAKCFEEQDDIEKALGLYGELLGHGPESGKVDPVLKRLQDKVLHFRLICLNHPKRKDYHVASEEAQEWLKENRGLASSRLGLGIQWEMVRALELLAKKETTPESDKAKMFQQALTAARSINRFPGEYKDVSNAMIQKLMVDLNRDPGDPKDFATAFGIARNLVQDISKQSKEVQGASGSERKRLEDQLQASLKEAARILNIGLSVAGGKDEPKDVNQARYFLAYIYYRMRDNSRESRPDHSFHAAVIADYIARKNIKSQPELALDAAYLAQAAYIQAYHGEPEGKRDAEINHVIDVCNFITANWPNSDKAHDSRMAIGRVYTEIQQPGKAAEQYALIPESAPQYLEAQLEAGNAFWYAYLFESVRPEAERKPKEELDGLLKQSQAILQSALAKFEAQIPGDISQVDETRLGNLTRAKVNYAQILNGSGDYKSALAVLAEGRLAVLAAVAPPDGDEEKRSEKGNIKSRQYAGLVYQVLLRTYVGLQDLDKARATMRELEKIVGVGGGSASLTRIYLDLGKELEKEVQRLQTASDPRLADVLKSFENFLQDMFQRKEGHDFSSLIWVAETYKALGEGLEKGDSAKSENYFGKAVAALQMLLDTEAAKPGIIPSPAAHLGVRLRLVMCKRRQRDFDSAHALIVSILKEKSKAVDVQEEAARVFQDWAARGGADMVDKYAVAIEGSQAKKGKGPDDKRIWGWAGLAERIKSNLLTNPKPEYEKQYLDASYNAAYCWFKYATGQTTKDKEKELLAEAYKAVRGTAGLIPNLGDAETWTRFNTLYREIQQDMRDLGMDEMKGKEVSDLERRRTALTKEERAAAKAAARKNSEELALANPDDDSPSKDKKNKAGTKANTGGKSKPKQASGGSGTLITVLVLLVAAGGGAAWYFLVFQKKAKPRRRRVVVDDGPVPDLESVPTPAVKTKKR